MHHTRTKRVKRCTPVFFLVLQCLLLLLQDLHYQTLFASAAHPTDLSVRAWQNLGYNFTTYPELPYVQGKSNTGIAISGGGSRSYTSTMGYLRAFHDLGLLNRTRYLSTVSGGSWAATAYTFQQGLKDQELLGEIPSPEEIEWTDLQFIPGVSARGNPVRRSLIADCLKMFFRGELKSLWYEVISSVFLEPSGIPPDTLYAWGPDHLADIISRNPSLANETFTMPCQGAKRCDHRPFLLINSVMFGPERDAPFWQHHRHFTLLEWSPVYVGIGHTLNVTYSKSESNNGDTDANSVVVGGYVEPIGFGAGPSDGDSMIDESNRSKHNIAEVERRRRLGSSNDIRTQQQEHMARLSQSHLLANETEGIIALARPQHWYNLANATGTSSWAPGSILADVPFIDSLDKYVGLEVAYKSPLSSKIKSQKQFMQSKASSMLLGDAGSLDSQGFFALVRRRLDRIVVLVNTPIPITPFSKWDPNHRLPVYHEISGAFSALFGIDIDPPTFTSIGIDFSRNHVFALESFAEVVVALQEAQQRGTGAVTTSSLVTIENPWWGIPAGLKIDVTWVFLGRVFEWEKRLNKEMQSKVLPYFEDKTNPANLPWSGPLTGFPHFPTTQVHLTAPQANLLADLAGWVVHQNADIFRKALE